MSVLAAAAVEYRRNTSVFFVVFTGGKDDKSSYY